jgi:cell division protease FtsH
MPLRSLTLGARLRLRYLATTLLAMFLLAVPSARAAEPVHSVASLSSALQPSRSANSAATKPAGIPPTYTELISDIASRRVALAAFATSLQQVSVKLRNGQLYTVGYPPGAEQVLSKGLIAGGARVTFNSGAASSGSGLNPMVLFVLAGTFALGLGMVLRRAGTGRPGMATGAPSAGPAPQPVTAAPDVLFEDVAGCDEAAEELADIIEFLTDPRRFTRMNARVPKGVLLYGPPGNGKTLLAKAVAGEAQRLLATVPQDVPTAPRQVSFFSTSGSEFVEMFVGMGAARIRSLFAEARKHAPAVVFIDEIDAVGTKRGAGGESGGAREDDKTLNQLLVELDGFGGADQVVVIAATNLMDNLDPALLRPGRLSRQVQVSPPDEAGRRAILAVHSRGKPLAEDADLDRIAHITAGQSGAELAELVNEAAIWAARHDRTTISNDDLWEGLCRVIAGPKKASAMIADGEREVVAYHEAGHVLAGELCPSQDKTQHATIEARGRALGFALKGQTDRGLHDEQYFHEQLIFILGGRAAEYVQYGTVSSGAANDLQQANLIARQAVEKLGLSPRVGQLISTGAGLTHSLSEQMRAVVDQEVRRLVADAYRDAVKLISEHRHSLDRIAGALLGAGRIDRMEIELAMEGAVAVAHRPRVSHSPHLVSVGRRPALPGADVEAAEPGEEGTDGRTGGLHPRRRGHRGTVRPRLAAALLNTADALNGLVRRTGRAPQGGTDGTGLVRD